MSEIKVEPYVPDEDYDPRTREWYTTAIQEKGDPVIVSPYLDAQTDTIMISISKIKVSRIILSCTP